MKQKTAQKLLITVGVVGFIGAEIGVFALHGIERALALPALLAVIAVGLGLSRLFGLALGED